MTNLADGNGDVVARLMGKVEAIKKNLPVKVNMRLQFDIDTVYICIIAFISNTVFYTSIGGVCVKLLDVCVTYY